MGFLGGVTDIPVKWIQKKKTGGLCARDNGKYGSAL